MIQIAKAIVKVTNPNGNARISCTVQDLKIIGRNDNANKRPLRPFNAVRIP